jgi:hypothetical protein
MRVIAAEAEQQREQAAFLEQRKQAAVKIASWYKSCLLRRRQKELIQLALKVRGWVWRHGRDVRGRGGASMGAIGGG